jgi:CBS domain containing-hemolysin-like protein
LKELLLIQKNKKWSETLNKLNLSSVVKVPLTQPIHSLLDLFKKSCKHIAIIIDEYGGVAWLVSLEDVVEEVFWEIHDETDKEVDPIRLDWNGGFLFQSEVRVEEMLNKFELDFDDVWLDEKEMSWETLSYFVTSYLQRFPKKWEDIILNINKEFEDNINNWDLSLKVLNVENNIIWDIKIGVSKK